VLVVLLQEAQTRRWPIETIVEIPAIHPNHHHLWKLLVVRPADRRDSRLGQPNSIRATRDGLRTAFRRLEAFDNAIAIEIPSLMKLNNASRPE
jgi:hypothetical protein